MGIKRYVTPYVAKYLSEIVATARECGITELYLFGSSTSFDFKFWKSDLDFACDGTDMQRYEFNIKLRKIQEYSVDVLGIEDVKEKILL